jgi:hypothetical protein
MSLISRCSAAVIPLFFAPAALHNINVFSLLDDIPADSAKFHMKPVTGIAQW